MALGILVGSIGTILSVVALVLYAKDRLAIEPVLIQTYVSRDTQQEYCIESTISNEGGRKAEGCDVVVEIGGNMVTHLTYAPVDSPFGRIGVDWPDETAFTLYPKRPMWVRGYVKAPPNTRIAVVFRRKGREVNRIPFTLP